MAFKIGEAVLLIKGELSSFNKDLGDAERMVKKTMGNILKDTAAVGKGLTAAGVGITGSLGLCVKEATSFGSELAKVNTLGVKDLGAMGEAAKNAAMLVGGNLGDSVKGLYDILSVGIPEENAPEYLIEASKAAVAGVTDIATAVNLGTSLTGVFGKSVKDTFGEAFVSVKVGKTTVEELAASVGNLAPTMKAAGLGSDQMLSGIAVLTVQGIKTSEAVTGLKSAISNVIKPTADAQKAAQALGIDFSVTALRTKGLGGFLQELSQKTGGNIQTMAQFFGSVEGLNAVMALTSKDGAKLYLDTMTQMPGAAAEAQKAFDALVAADPSLAWKQLKTELTVLAVEIGQAMLPALKSLADWLKPMLDKLREWVKANPELTATIVKVAAVIGGLMLVVGPLLIALPGLAVAFSVVGTAIAALFSPVGAVVAAIAAAAIAIGVAAYYIYTHWEQVAQTAVGLWEGFKEALVNVWERIKNAIASAVEGVGYIVGRLMGWLVRLMTDPIGALEEAWNYITGLFRGGWEYIVSLWNWGAGVLDSIGQALTTIITAPWQAAIDAVKWLWSLFTGGAAAGASDAMAAGRASGGPVHAGQAYVVGEQGPERFVPSVSGYVYPSVGGIAASASGGYGGDYNGGGNVGSININLGGVVVREEADIDRISSRIAEELQRVLRGREGRQLVGARA